MVKGGLKYVPKEIFDELDIVKSRYNIEKDSEAFKQIVNWSKSFRELHQFLGYEQIRRKRK